MERITLPLSVQVENLEMANEALKAYILRLEGKIARYEKMLHHCPHLRCAKLQESQRWKAAESPEPAEAVADDDFEEDFDDDDFDDDDDFEDDDFDEDDDVDEDFPDEAFDEDDDFEEE